MIKNKIGLGLLGCGRVAQHYRKIFESGVVKNFNIIAVCDLETKKASDLADAFSSKRYSNVENLLADPEIDLVHVLTYSGDHFNHAKLALEAGKHVLVEKPIALLPDQAVQLDEVAKKYNLMCGVVFQNRLNPAINALRNAITANRFGTIVSASVRLHWCRFQDYYEDGWHGTWEMDGGVINQQAIHHVDALNWLCGPVEQCCAQKTNRLNTLEAEDTMVAALKFKNGALGTIEVTSAARPRDFEAVISIVGEKGYAKIGGIALNEIHEWHFVNSLDEDKTIPKDYTQHVETGYGLSHGPLINSTIERLLSGSITPVVSSLEGKNTATLVHALYKSTETNQWVSLADNLLSNKLGKPN